jgi:hypothetical protein
VNSTRILDDLKPAGPLPRIEPPAENEVAGFAEPLA